MADKDNNGLRALGDLGAAFGLGATDQITGRDNLGQFVRGLAQRREKADAAARNQTLLQSDIALGFVDENDLATLGGRKSVEGLDTEAFEASRSNLRAKVAERKGDEAMLDAARQRLVASGRTTPDEAAAMDQNQLAEAEGSALLKERAEEEAVQNADDTVASVQNLVTSLAAQDAVSGDDVADAQAQVDVARQDISSNPNLTGAQKTAQLRALESTQILVRAVQTRAKSSDIALTLESDAAAGLAAYSAETNPTVRTSVEREQAFVDTEKQVDEAMLLSRTDPAILDELDGPALEVLRDIQGQDAEALSSGSAKTFIRRDSGEAARVAGIDLGPLKRGIEDAQKRITVLHPEQTRITQAITNLQAQNPIAADLLGLQDYDVNGLSLDEAGNLQGDTDVLSRARFRLGTPEGLGGYSLKDLYVLGESAQTGFFDGFDKSFKGSIEGAVRQRRASMSSFSAEAERVEAKDDVFGSGLTTLNATFGKFENALARHSTLRTERTAGAGSQGEFLQRRATVPEPPTFEATSPQLRASIFGNPGEAEEAQAEIKALDERMRNPSFEDQFRIEDMQAQKLDLQRRILEADTRQATSGLMGNFVEILGEEGGTDPGPVLRLIEDHIKSSGLQGGAQGTETFQRKAGTESDPADFVDAAVELLQTNVGAILKTEGRTPDEVRIMRNVLLDQLAEYQEVRAKVEQQVLAGGLPAKSYGPEFTEKNLVQELTAQILGER